ncbi:hypothetical protein TruAng_011104 [Truncatella angustata]|nr:hypothetical protein TruAng_011104 [Truncatella angustata]
MYNASSAIGSIAAGWIQDWFGRRAVFLISIVIVSAGIAIAYISENSAQFLGSKICTGFAVGMIQSATQTYVSEIAPLPIRGMLLSLNTIMMNFGFLIAISSTFSRVAIQDPSAFRTLFAAGWAFPGLLAIGLPFMPESPYWYVMKGKRDAAKKSLQRLANGKEEIETLLNNIDATIEEEKRLGAEASSYTYLDCFRGINRRRTIIILVCMYMPKAVGSVLSSNAPYFLNQTGLDSHTVLLLIQVGVALGVVSSLVNVVLMMKLGRRVLMMFGVGLCCAMYLVMGIGAVLPRTTQSLLAIGIALQFTTLSYGPAVGSAYAVAGEVSASNLRAKSLGIGGGFMYFMSTLWTIILPYLFNKDQANLGGNLGWIFLGLGIIMFVTIYFYIPETKNRTYSELDQIFERRTPARQF